MDCAFEQDSVSIMTLSCLYGYDLPLNFIETYMRTMGGPSDVQGSLVLNHQLYFDGDYIRRQALSWN